MRDRSRCLGRFGATWQQVGSERGAARWSSPPQFEALADHPGAPGFGDLVDEVKMRWTGLYVLLYDGGVPTEVGFWGYSGD